MVRGSNGMKWIGWMAIVLWLFAVFGHVSPVLANGGVSVSNFDRARELVQQGNCVAAIARLTEEVRGHPDNAIAFKLRGYCHQRLKESNAALADYSRVIDLVPSSADAYIDRGLARGFRGEYELAIADYNRALAIAPEETRAWNARGVAYCRQGLADAGRSDFNRAAQLSREQGDRELYRLARRAAHRLCAPARERATP